MTGAQITGVVLFLYKHVCLIRVVGKIFLLPDQSTSCVLTDVILGSTSVLRLGVLKFR